MVDVERIKKRIEWKQVPGFPMYSATKNGDVKSSRYNRVLKPLKNIMGYHRVNVYNGKIRKTKSVASIVLETFVGPRPNGHQAAHLNGNQIDNRLENLRWVTFKENIRQRNEHGSCEGERNGWAKLTNQSALAIFRLCKIYGEDFLDLKALGYCFGVNESTVRNVVSGHRWKSALSKISHGHLESRAGGEGKA